MYAAHTWQALLCGRPSHVNDACWDVEPLTEDVFEGRGCDDEDLRQAILRQVPVCIAMCELSVIAADILGEF
jgi:hypothetical protein